MNLADTMFCSTVRRAPAPQQAQQAAAGEHLARVKPLLDRWAEWMSAGGTLAEGAPRESPMAPDARVQSFEDLEIEVDKRVVAAVDTCVWELQVLQREAVMRHYGFKAAGAWQADWDQQFNLALEALFGLLKSRIAC